MKPQPTQLLTQLTQAKIPRLEMNVSNYLFMWHRKLWDSTNRVKTDDQAKELIREIFQVVVSSLGYKECLFNALDDTKEIKKLIEDCDSLIGFFFKDVPNSPCYNHALKAPDKGVSNTEVFRHGVKVVEQRKVWK